jgi:hypothetical protein
MHAIRPCWHSAASENEIVPSACCTGASSVRPNFRTSFSGIGVVRSNGIHGEVSDPRVSGIRPIFVAALAAAMLPPCTQSCDPLSSRQQFPIAADLFAHPMSIYRRDRLFSKMHYPSSPLVHRLRPDSRHLEWRASIKMPRRRCPAPSAGIGGALSKIGGRQRCSPALRIPNRRGGLHRRFHVARLCSESGQIVGASVKSALCQEPTVGWGIANGTTPEGELGVGCDPAGEKITTKLLPWDRGEPLAHMASLPPPAFRERRHPGLALRFVHRFRPVPRCTQATAPSAAIPLVRHFRMNSR